jgi:hypothetical protein
VAEINMETGEVTEPEEPVEEPVEAPGEDEDEAEEPQEATESEAVSFDTMSEGEQRKVLDKLDREAERHTKRLQEIMVEDALMLLPCELCNPRTAGWVDLAAVTPELRQRVRIMIGDREPVKREHDRYSRRCEACDGEGTVDTGSKVEGQKELPCIDCAGKGWLNIGPERLGVRPAAPALAIAPNGPTAPEPPAAPDAGLSPEEQAAYDLLRSKNFAVIAPVRV